VTFLEDLVQVRSSGEGLEEAVAAALRHFGCTRAEIEVDVLQAESRGFLGIGRRPAQIRARLLDRAYTARFLCTRLLALNGWDATVGVQPCSEQIDLPIDGQDVSQIIGRHGQTLEALQYLVTTLTDRIAPGDLPLLLDAGGYRLKRHRYLRGLAQKLSQQVRTSGQRITLDPLPLHERRLLHLFIRDQRGVTSSSVGQGYEKRIVVDPVG